MYSFGGHNLNLTLARRSASDCHFRNYRCSSFVFAFILARFVWVSDPMEILRSHEFKVVVLLDLSGKTPGSLTQDEKEVLQITLCLTSRFALI